MHVCILDQILCANDIKVTIKSIYAVPFKAEFQRVFTGKVKIKP